MATKKQLCKKATNKNRQNLHTKPVCPTSLRLDVVNCTYMSFSTNDRFRSEKYESNYLENPFPEMKGVNSLSKTHRNDKSNLNPKTVLQEKLHVDRFS